MAVELQTVQNVAVAILTGTLDDVQGPQLTSLLGNQLPPGRRLIVDCSGLTDMTAQGQLALIAAHNKTSTPENRTLALAGLDPALWQKILDNGGDFLFTSHGTLTQALESMGVSTNGAVPTPSPAPATTEAALPADYLTGTTTRQFSTMRRDEELANVWNTPATGPSAPPETGPPPPSQAEVDSTWASYKPAAPAEPAVKTKAKSPGGGGGKGLLIGAVILVVVLLVGAGLAFFLLPRNPEISISQEEVLLEDGGRETDEVTVYTKNGRLIEPPDMPPGLYFVEMDEGEYRLNGSLKSGATSTSIELLAESKNGQRSASVPLSIKVKEKPLSWQLNSLKSLKLMQGTIVSGSAKFVSGAKSAGTLEPLPEGLRVQRNKDSETAWEIGGTPSVNGTFDVTFVAESLSGKRHEESITLTVAPVPQAPKPADPKKEAPRPIEDKPRPADTAEAPKPPAPPAPEPAGKSIDDGMRQFLLERIEKLPSRYTDEDRENLRLVVNGLKEARMIQRVYFEADGQVTLSPDQLTQLKSRLEASENAALLKDPHCQILIVGFASKSGSPSANVRVSKKRARAVDEALSNAINRNADLCGDYGPTDVVNPDSDEKNRAVEVYAGTLDIPSALISRAEEFKEDFNRRHGVR
jgi:outer membrane protein OmpA-like peptidoglycan-associated protein/anti-anti-sigma regulatory factor